MDPPVRRSRQAQPRCRPALRQGLYRPTLEGLEERCLLSAGLTEFPVPTAGAGPVGITAGPDGNLWFTENATNQIGRITPAGTVTEFPIVTSGSDPAGITAGPDGNLWFTEQFGNKIGRITPAGILTEFPVGTANSTLLGITAGPDGNLWFTESQANQIGRITPLGTISEFPLSAGSKPVGIVTGPDGNLWFTESGTNKIGRITITGSVTGEFALPTANADPEGIAAGPDGNLWFTETRASQVGRVSPAGRVTEFAVATASPVGITAGPDGALWFTDAGGNRVDRVNVAGNVQPIVSLAAGAGPFGIVTGPDGKIWFTERDADRIGSVATRTPNQLYVTALFRDLLGRNVDDSGLATFTGLLDRGQASRADVALDVESSVEYRGDVVQGLYKQLLHRGAEARGLSDWVGFLGQGHTARDLEAQILASPEYFQGRGEGTVGGFMTAVYQDLPYLDADQAGFASSSQFLAGANGGDAVGGITVRLGLVTGFVHRWLADATAAEGWFGQFLHRPVDTFSFEPLVDALQGGLADERFVMGVLGSAEYFANNT